MNRRFFVTVFFLLFCFRLSPAIDIRIMDQGKMQAVEIFPVTPNYTILADGKLLQSFPTNSFFQVQAVEDSLYLKYELDTIGTFASITFLQTTGGSCKLKATGMDAKAAIYPGNLIFRPYYCNLRIINSLPLEEYLPGVVEAEGGMMQPIEFLKVQAILCRTYALGHLRRHEAEGFALCDKEHCQVYKGCSSRNNEVNKAVQLTEGLVITDEKPELITAAFHSNCGGQTCDSKDVWNAPAAGLKSITDTFCLSGKNARWTKEISKEKWMSYLSGKFSASDTVAMRDIFSGMLQERKPSVSLGNKKMYVKDVRADWNLKSAFFTTQFLGNKVILSGRGFGHGIGLCQEGAIQMAKKGYSAFEIIHYYYTDVLILSVNKMPFFLQDEE